MATAISLTIFAIGCVAVVYLYRDLRAKRFIAQRLATNWPGDGAAESAPIALPSPQPFARRHYILPWLAAAGLTLLAHYAARIPWTYCGALGGLSGLLLTQLDAILLDRAFQRIESQLADAIDLMVSSLKVGASLQSALESALRESQPPLRQQLDEVVGRIRLGDDPRSAFAGLATRVPLETFHLFVTALVVHWDVGGSLTGTLATVGRTVRDRIEIALRVRSLTTQARASVVAIMCTTYFIAALVWRSSPARMSHFLAADVGEWMAGISILLQGIGIVWISYLRNVRF